MQSLTQPMTPATKKPFPPTPLSQQANDSPGPWQHPRIHDITRRMNASIFTDQNLERILVNIGGGIALHTSWRIVEWILPGILLKFCHPWASLTYSVLAVILLYNILYNLYPLVRSKDEVTDIALTPAQRKMLGLNPTSTPTTPGSTYSTPPRYKRTVSTPLSHSPASRASDSPLSRKGSPSSFLNSTGGGEYSPNASPLLQKAVGGRNSDRNSPSVFGGARDMLGSSMAGSKPATVGLSKKWIYEKRRSSGSGKMFS